MTGFFGKLFGSKKSEKNSGGAVELLENTTGELIRLSGLELSFEVEETEDEVVLDIFGDDEELLLAKEGQLLDAFQLYLKRVLQHQMPDVNVNLVVDCDGFREDADKALIELAEKLRDVALEKGKSVYFRALSPKDRKVVHQFLAEDSRVKSRSIGEGHFKKIKIFPVKSNAQELGENRPSV